MMFQEYVLFKGYILDVLEKDLEQAKKENMVAGDRRDSDGCDEAWVKINYIEGLLKKARAFHIVT